MLCYAKIICKLQFIKVIEMETSALSDVAQTETEKMSLWDLVWSSDTITKVVMIGLIAASVWSWAIIL